LDTWLSLASGLGLAAACGFRVFVPLLVLSIAARAGAVPLSEGFAWMASDGALAAFAIATVLEVVAYFVPWLDHVLDAVATPAAVVAGMITTASVLTELPPLLRWTAAVVGGGGLAALVQGSTVALRVGSIATTGGLGNPVVAAGELVASLLAAALAVLAPLLVVVLVIVLLWSARRVARRSSRSRPPA
jgi:hypothetical protein